eukprot:m.64243 g.64243  ORF g.64243 m.64243 type:complete len:500 (+) comp9707_c0_seq1:116-1615(+)
MAGVGPPHERGGDPTEPVGQHATTQSSMAALQIGEPESRLLGTSAVRTVFESAARRARENARELVGIDDLRWALTDSDARSATPVAKDADDFLTHKYTPNATNILREASARAREKNHVFIGTEDILYSMFTAPHTFSRSRAVERMIKRGVRPELVFGQAELSENAQLAIQAAIREANRTGQTHVGTEMLLWALFQKTKHDSEARYWLANMGVLTAERNALTDLLAGQGLIEPAADSTAKMLVVGGLAGAFECAVMQPIIYWKTVAQTRIKFSVKAMYKGLVVNAGSIGPISALQYAGNGVLLNLYVNLAGENPTERAALGIAGLSGAISSFVTTPAELLMIAQQRYSMTLAAAARAIYASRGLLGLFQGFTVTAVRESGWTFGFLGLTPQVKAALQEDSKFCRRNEVAASALASVFSGIVCVIYTQPADTVKTLIQVDCGIEPQKRGSFEAIKHLCKRDGITGLWRGAPARALRCVGGIFILGQCQSYLNGAFDKIGFT